MVYNCIVTGLYFFIDGGSSHLPISLILWNDVTIIAVVTILCLHLVGAVKTLNNFQDIDMGFLKCLLKWLRNVAIDLEKRLVYD